jgi:hypothetical protein
MRRIHDRALLIHEVGTDNCLCMKCHGPLRRGRSRYSVRSTPLRQSGVFRGWRSALVVKQQVEAYAAWTLSIRAGSDAPATCK